MKLTLRPPVRMLTSVFVLLLVPALLPADQECGTQNTGVGIPDGQELTGAGWSKPGAKRAAIENYIPDCEQTCFGENNEPARCDQDYVFHDGIGTEYFYFPIPVPVGYPPVWGCTITTCGCTYDSTCNPCQ